VISPPFQSGIFTYNNSMILLRFSLLMLLGLSVSVCAVEPTFAGCLKQKEILVSKERVVEPERVDMNHAEVSEEKHVKG